MQKRLAFNEIASRCSELESESICIEKTARVPISDSKTPCLTETRGSGRGGNVREAYAAVRLQSLNQLGTATDLVYLKASPLFAFERKEVNCFELNLEWVN